jgi:hypothetical protein
VKLADEEEKQAVKLLRGQTTGSVDSDKAAHMAAMVGTLFCLVAVCSPVRFAFLCRLCRMWANLARHPLKKKELLLQVGMIDTC